MASLNTSTSNTNSFNPQVNWIPIFKGEKFEQWNIQIKSIFITQDIWDIIQDGYEKPKNATEEASWDDIKKDLYKHNLRRDNFALSIIYRGVDETIFPTIITATMAKDAWSTLQMKYGGFEKMDNNPQQEEITTMQDEIYKVATSLQKMESMISPQPKCWIYTVPDFIRNGNEDCYRPLSTSIGPVFYKRPELEAMQEFKWMVLKGVQKHPDDIDNACQGYERYIKYVKENEREIQDCYQSKIDLPSDEFIQMIVLDAAFLIYLLYHGNEEITEDKFRVPFRSLKQDLFVEENQLPFFVLQGFYDIASGGDDNFVDLALDLIENFSAGFPRPEVIRRIRGQNNINPSQIRHLVHLRMCCCENILDVTESRVDLPKMCCCCLPFKEQHDDAEEEDLYSREASQNSLDVTESGVDAEEEYLYSHQFYTVKHLTAVGVKFKLNDQSAYEFDIKFHKKSGVLEIPRLILQDYNESVFRSILFFEQSCDYENRYFTDYFAFLDDLIDDVEDIRILQQNKILHNDLGSDKEAAHLINKLTKYISYDSSWFAFSKVRKDLRDYASTNCNQWKAIFWSKYFNHPWTITSVVAAIILFILTLLQTITSFLQLHQK